MSDPDRPLDVYAEGYGGPDLETTARAKQRVQAYARERASRRTRWTLRIQGVVAAVLVGGAGLGLWALLSPTATTEASKEHKSSPVVATQQDASEVSLAEGGTMRVAPNSKVRLGQPDGDPAIDLLVGKVEVSVPARARPWRFRSGDYALDAAAADFHMERRNGAPRVTVQKGAVTLFGPDLPDAGIEIAAQDG